MTTVRTNVATNVATHLARLDLLDCTLRDGGYNNAWDFPRPLVARYLAALDRTGVRWVEMGYRAVAPEPGAGHFRASADALLRDLTTGLSLEVAVMIEARRILGEGLPTERVRALFPLRAESPVALVRIAVAASDVPRIAPIAEALHALGYQVALNLMQASVLEPAHVARLAQVLDLARPDFLYLADSFGGLTPGGTAERVRAVVDSTAAIVGFHAHDNLGLALANSIAAARAGAGILDGAVRGMGRGAGNLRTEQALAWLEAEGRNDVSCASLAELVEEDFAVLQRRYAWGPSAAYAMSGLRGIHPTYVQELLRDSSRTITAVLGALDLLARDDGRGTFDAGRLASMLPRPRLRALR